MAWGAWRMRSQCHLRGHSLLTSALTMSMLVRVALAEAHACPFVSAHDSDGSTAGCFGWCSSAFAGEHCTWCKCAACDWCASPDGGTAFELPAASVASSAASAPGGGSPSAGASNAACSSGLADDVSYKDCQPFCNAAFKSAHCSTCKCRACGFWCATHGCDIHCNALRPAQALRKSPSPYPHPYACISSHSTPPPVAPRILPRPRILACSAQRLRTWLCGRRRRGAMPGLVCPGIRGDALLALVHSSRAKPQKPTLPPCTARIIHERTRPSYGLPVQDTAGLPVACQCHCMHCCASTMRQPRASFVPVEPPTSPVCDSRAHAQQVQGLPILQAWSRVQAS